MKSIMFFIENPIGGGAEQILKNVAESIDKNLFDTTVVTVTNPNQKKYYKNSTNQKCFTLSNPHNLRAINFINKFIVSFSIRTKVKTLYKIFIRKKFDIEIAFCEGYATKIIGNSPYKNSKKIAWVHTDVINNPWSEYVFGNAENERKCYEKFDAIVCVSQTMKDSFVKKYGMAEKVHVLYNIIDYEKIKMLSSENAEIPFSQKPCFVMAGRLVKVKAYDRMIKVCAKLRDNNYDFSVIVAGDGEEKINLINMIKNYKLVDRIRLLDFQENPYKYIAKSDCFVCSSYAEGYSTAVTEAVVLNVPVITTDCSGMREIFGDRECGIICENSDDGLYNALKKVLDNPDLLEHFRKEEKIRSTDFNKENLVKKIEDFFDTI